MNSTPSHSCLQVLLKLRENSILTYDKKEALYKWHCEDITVALEWSPNSNQ